MPRPVRAGKKPQSSVGRDGRSDVGDITPAVKELESMTLIMPVRRQAIT
jgi:hypothetical protein